MEKDKIIQLIEQELVQADEANSNTEFEKHIYAIHTLTSLVSNQSTSQKVYRDNSFNMSSSFKASKGQNGISKQGVSEDEIRAMGGKVSDTASTHTSPNTSLTANKLVTDDEIGNGDSIFDF